ncbi:Rnf-Nqr domain containing protein [Pseudomonas entomophila]|nr:Rnf-Nqr domain containing protein [Pseudomonas entomophila]WMW05070.1 Rnf-Nqr domain containing protein [Pseudomonas entomophila]
MNRYGLLIASLPPLIGATGTIMQAAAIAACSLLLVSLHQGLMAPLRNTLAPLPRLYASLMLAAALATCLQLGLRAWALPLTQSLGYYPTLLVLPCLAIDLLLPATDRWRPLLAHLCGLLLACLALATCRQLANDWLGLHIALLAPGALILLGLLLGLYNHLRPPTSPRRQGTL